MNYQEAIQMVTCTVLTDANRFDPVAKTGEKIQLGRFYAEAFAKDGIVSIDKE